jgi:catechol 2,3-dioxygenase-like lactoylglutathione lyase family enzyme
VTDPPPVVADDGDPVRVASRSFLVDDLDASIAVVARTFGWEPSERTGSSDGAVATFRGTLPGSASLELLQPAGDGPDAAHRGRFGAGAYRITIAVQGLEAAAARLREQGAALDDGSGTTGRVRIDPAHLGGLIVDLVDATDPEDVRAGTR